MKKYYLTYQPAEGFIDHWLVLGPHDTPIEERPGADESWQAFRSRMLQARDHVTPDFNASVVELDTIPYRDDRLFWQVEHCKLDHLLDKSDVVSAWTYRRVWLFTRLSWPGVRQATLHLSATCPVAVWLNGKHVHYLNPPDDTNGQMLHQETITINLKPGNNDLLLRMDQIGIGHTTMCVAARLDAPASNPPRINVPTVTDQPQRRLEWERAFGYAYMDRAVYTRDDQIKVICRKDMPSWRHGVVRLEKPDGRIYAETIATFKPGEVIESIYGVQLPYGVMRAVLMPPPGNYYDLRFRARHELPFAVTDFRYATEVVGGFDDRLIELMQETQRSEDIVYAELAKMALGWWEMIDVKALRKGIERIRNGEAGTLADLLGLLAIRIRMSSYERFPAELVPDIDKCILGFDYSQHADVHCEAGELMLLACRILAGQMYATENFTVSTLSGRQERSRAEKLAVEWLSHHGQTGFNTWNTDTDLLIAALADLIHLAKSRTVRELATVLLDKTLFGVALNSFQGVFAGTRGRVRASWVKSGRFAPEAALNRLLWGLGCYNHCFKGAVSLALAGSKYELPELIRAIALDRPPEAWSRERQGSADGGVNIVSYKTPDYLLSSVQDYRAGQHGQGEHVWQATLAPEAVVFTTHPACASESDSCTAGWWSGNGSLPRLAQWKDALLAIYNLPDTAWLDFTHAYFPCYAFDEYVLEQGWAFARKGDAYLALYAANGMNLTEMGADAFRELRSPGTQNVWLCQMGRKESDGDFATFRAAILARRPVVDGLHMQWETLRGDKLAFGWTGPLTVNGEEQAITGFKHFDSPYAVAEMPAETMDIIYGQNVMRLHFA